MKRTLLALAPFAVVAALAIASPAPHAAPGEAAPTFSNEVVRIFQQSCQSCHRPGQIAPFSLLTYDDAAPYADLIAEMTAEREMPPWKPLDGCGEFLGKRALSDAEIETIGRWAAAGAPEGDRRDLPPPVDFPDGWQLGEPDLVVASTPNGYRIPASATDDIYRCFTVETGFDADRFITGVEVRPGNGRIVHHVLLYVDATGASVELDRDDPGPGYSCFGGPGFIPTGSLGGWAPGAAPTVLREGIGYFVPRGARIVMQIHYQPTGVDEVDRTEIGLHFARAPVYKDALFLPILNRDFTIPAGASDYPVSASVTLPPYANLTLESIAPHMHLLGREMHVTAFMPDGTERCLIDIHHWDFHWQGSYTYVEPVKLPGGTRIDVQARYDNSAENDHQPNDPPVDVSWGEETTDEMCIAFLGITVDAARRVPSEPEVSSVVTRGSRLVVEGRDLRKGAFIEIDGRLVGDTRVKTRSRVLSKRAWRELAPPGSVVDVRVLNPDGARSAPVRVAL